MRITRESLMKLAREHAAQRARQDRNLICIYLTGSLLNEDVLLGGTADIDLVCVHDDTPAHPREVIRITDDVHLDIAHYSQTVYHQPRHLRSDPWVGGYLCQNPITLHDIQHWFEFTQASVHAQFYLPNNILERARPMAEAARASWMNMEASEDQGSPQSVLQYLKALENAANAVACLSGPPLTERRFLLQFPERAQAIDRPGLSAGLIDLLADRLPEESNWQAWLPAWREAFGEANKLEGAVPRLHACRRAYYEKAANALWNDQPASALWLMLRIWTLAICQLPAGHPCQTAWNSAMVELGLSGQDFSTRLNGLDAYLDNVEETLDVWAQRNGL